MKLTSDEVSVELSKYGIEEEEEAGSLEAWQASNCRRLEATNYEATWLALQSCGLPDWTRKEPSSESKEQRRGGPLTTGPVEIWRRKRLERESNCVIV